MIQEPMKFWTIPAQVEVMQFLGWQNADEIHIWCNKVFYVPQGADHALRGESEHDRSRGDILDTASGFLVLRGDGENIRVNVRYWIVKTNDNRYLVYTDEEFKKNFTNNLGSRSDA